MMANKHWSLIHLLRGLWWASLPLYALLVAAAMLTPAIVLPIAALGLLPLVLASVWMLRSQRPRASVLLLLCMAVFGLIAWLVPAATVSDRGWKYVVFGGYLVGLVAPIVLAVLALRTLQSAART